MNKQIISLIFIFILLINSTSGEIQVGEQQEYDAEQFIDVKLYTNITEDYDGDYVSDEKITALYPIINKGKLNVEVIGFVEKQTEIRIPYYSLEFEGEQRNGSSNYIPFTLKLGTLEPDFACPNIFNLLWDDVYPSQRLHYRIDTEGISEYCMEQNIAWVVHWFYDQNYNSSLLREIEPNQYMEFAMEDNLSFSLLTLENENENTKEEMKSVIEKINLKVALIEKDDKKGISLKYKYEIDENELKKTFLELGNPLPLIYYNIDFTAEILYDMTTGWMELINRKDTSSLLTYDFNGKFTRKEGEIKESIIKSNLEFTDLSGFIERATSAGLNYYPTIIVVLALSISPYVWKRKR